ncbi:hypothetical protein RvY_11639 [Ramazzottius varieornatus]|uniref:RRM domain-containing protein n=1 Tax=Ramazzottius varieornatus TaxID=947166 RepID=A0A1D1VGR7_RAMVA|nr:hypothetical protein RvY_11639 [Ramazzottius varieornatus]
MSGWEDDVPVEPGSIKQEYPVQQEAMASHPYSHPPASNGVASIWQKAQPAWIAPPAVKPEESTEHLSVVRVRGIPFQESEYTFLKWLIERGVAPHNGVLGIHFVYNPQRQWSGDAFLQLRNDEDFKKAISLDKATMNSRYLEVFPSSPIEMRNLLGQTGLGRVPGDYAVRLRGLDFKVSREEIRDFFQGAQIAGGLNGVIISKSQDGRTTGEAYVLFENRGGVEQAVQKHKEKMGHRYVEIFLAGAAHIKSMLAEAGVAEGRLCGPPADGPAALYEQNPAYYPPHQGHPGTANGFRPSQQPCRIFMRGLPWHVTEQEIEQFFQPLKLQSVTKNMSPSNVFDGSAWVEFFNQADMEEGKKRDKTSLGHRYIELFTAEEVETKRITVGNESLSGGGGAARRPPGRGGRGGAAHTSSYSHAPGPAAPYGSYRDEMNPLPPPDASSDSGRGSPRGGGGRGRGDSRGGRGASRGGISRGDSRGGRGGASSRGAPRGRGGPTRYDRPPQSREGDRGRPPPGSERSYRSLYLRSEGPPDNGYAPPPQYAPPPAYAYQPQAPPRYAPSIPAPSYSNHPQGPPGFGTPPGYQPPMAYAPPQQYTQYPL